MENKLIGQGSYGCVVKPSFECKTKHDYTDKVSKIMSDKDAIHEQKEMEIFKNMAGIEEFAMAYPEVCKPKLNAAFKKMIKDCDASPVKRKIAYYNDYSGISMLLLDDGGVDIHHFLFKLFPKLSNHDKSVFFTSILNLIKGLQFFVDNNIIHHDIKKQNMVYNIETGKAKYIDFGLMNRIDKFIETAKKSKNDMAISWSNFPTELSCANKKFFNKDTCSQYKEKMKYPQFLERVANSFDTYSLSLAFWQMFSTILNDNMFYDDKFVKDAKALMKQYCTPNFFKRKTDYKQLYNDYNALLNDHIVYTSVSPSPSKQSIEIASTLSVSTFFTPRSSATNCPPGKSDYNPHTKKCVVKCKEGKVRNDKFRCVTKKQSAKKSNKTQKIKLVVTKKEECMKKGKELNPNTNRCVKPCAPGKMRNEDFKCVSNKL